MRGTIPVPFSAGNTTDVTLKLFRFRALTVVSIAKFSSADARLYALAPAVAEQNTASSTRRGGASFTARNV